MPPALLKEAISNSVIAVPPLARRHDFSIDIEENRKIIQFIEAGGVSTLLYGGNANFYHVRLSEYELLLQMLTELPQVGTTVIPSIGPSFGMMMAQVEMLKTFDFPSVMVLPTRDAITSAGAATAIRRTAEALGKPVVLYIKNEQGLAPADAVGLVKDSVVAAVKYAIVREDAAKDGYLNELLQGVSSEIVVSGMGEQPAIVHMRDLGLAGFTSGCVCVAPGLSQKMLLALNAGDYALAESFKQIFKPLEDLRNTIHPVRVLHEAVRLGGIAETGPLLPLLSNLEPEYHDAVADATHALMQETQVAR